MVRVAARGTHGGARSRDIPVKRVGDRTLLVRDVAQVVDGVEEPRSLAFVDDRPAHCARRAEAGRRQHGGGGRRRARGGREDGAGAAARRHAAGGARRLARSSASRSTTSKYHVLLGGLLTVFIVFLFLNSWRSTVITGLTLPISVIAAFIAMRLFGFTLNVLTLMGLSLAIGMLIDDAIVVRENIVRHMQRGKDHFDGRARRHGGDRPRGHGHHVHDHRRVHPGGVHGRHGGPVLLRVRHHGGGGGARVAVRQLHARPDAVLALVRPGRRGAPPRAASSARVLQRFNRRFDGLHVQLRAAARLVAAPPLGASCSWRVVAFLSAFPILGILGGDFMPDFNRGEYQVAFKATPGATLRETGDRARQMVREAASAARRRIHLHHDRRGGHRTSGR